MKLTTENINKLETNQLLGDNLECECGKKHTISTEYILIEEGAINKLPEAINKLGYKKILIVSDTNTEKIAGGKVKSILSKCDLDLSEYVFPVSDENLVPNEDAIGKLLVNVKKGTEVILAVGSGVLNDLSKFVAYKLEIPSMIVATAPSMDGYVATGSSLITGGLKLTHETDCPKALIGDLDILKEAPMDMILAGFGDIIGKYSALSDWKLSEFITGEYVCEVSYKMVIASLKKCIESTEGIKNRDPLAIKNLMDALVGTGIAMSYVGNSRPASGSEHHMAHYWEMMFLFEGKKAIFHGTKVGITTIVTELLREALANTKVDFDKAVSKAKAFDQDKWKETVTTLYQAAAQEIIETNEKQQLNDIGKRLERIEFIKSNYDKIIEIVGQVPSSKELKTILSNVGAPYNPKQVGIDEKTLLDSIVMAKEVRTRYSILNLVSDLGILEDIAQEVKDYLVKEEV